VSVRDISEAKNPDLRGSMAAMRRAAEIARTTAIQTNTGIIVSRDGKSVHHEVAMPTPTGLIERRAADEVAVGWDRAVTKFPVHCSLSFRKSP
jgi:hypothetical protein